MISYLVSWWPLFFLGFIIFLFLGDDNEHLTEKTIGKAFKWAGVYILMVFVYNLIFRMSHSEAYEVLNIFAWIYIVCAIGIVGENIYKRIKTKFIKKQDVSEKEKAV